MLAITPPQNFWLWFGSIWLSVGSLFLVIGIWVSVHRIMVNDRLEKEGRTTKGMVLTKEVYTTSSKSGSRSSPPIASRSGLRRVREKLCAEPPR